MADLGAIGARGGFTRGSANSPAGGTGGGSKLASNLVLPFWQSVSTAVQLPAAFPVQERRVTGSAHSFGVKDSAVDPGTEEFDPDQFDPYEFA